jgi:hypothetical protein
MPSQTPVDEDDDSLVSDYSPFLALYRRDADHTVTALADFKKKHQFTISCDIDARRGQGTVAFMDLTIKSGSWQSRSVMVTLAKKVNRVVVAPVESIFIDNGHGAPINPGMQVRVYCLYCH